MRTRMEKKRCNFSFGTTKNQISEKFLAYHDTRWCKPEHNDRELFAMLVLEGMQAGVSWNLILAKEENFRKAFDGFSAEGVWQFWQIYLELYKWQGCWSSPAWHKGHACQGCAFRKGQRRFEKTRLYLCGADDYLFVSAGDWDHQRPLGILWLQIGKTGAWKFRASFVIM